MKSILILLCAAILLQDFVSCRLNLKDGEVFVGVSQLNLNEYITKALKGFKSVILEGDDELDFKKMDPYKLEPTSWDFIDTSSAGKKYKLKFSTTDTITIKGLSNYMVSGVQANARDMKATFVLSLPNIEIESPYKLEGYLYKSLLPIYGEGVVKLSNPGQSMEIGIDLATEGGKVKVEKVFTYRYSQNTQIKVTGLMDLSDAFANIIVDDILNEIVMEHGSIIQNKFIRDVVEKAVDGMTTEEFFEYLDYFAKKNDNQQ